MELKLNHLYLYSSQSKQFIVKYVEELRIQRIDYSIMVSDEAYKLVDMTTNEFAYRLKYRFDVEKCLYLPNSNCYPGELEIYYEDLKNLIFELEELDMPNGLN